MKKLSIFFLVLFTLTATLPAWGQGRKRERRLIPNANGEIVFPLPREARRAPAPAKETAKEETPVLKVSDPKLQKLLDKQAKIEETQKKLQERLSPTSKQLQEVKKQIADYYFETRLAEIEKNQPKQEPNGQSAGLGVVDFPEMDGSEACSFLGQIIAATVLDLPYKWDVPAKGNDDYYYKQRPLVRWHYDFNEAGDAFVKQNTTQPFRPYLTYTAAPHNAPASFIIGRNNPPVPISSGRI